MFAAFLGTLIGALADRGDLSLLKGKDSKISYGLVCTPEAARRYAFFEAVCERAASMLLEEDAFLVEERRWIESLDPAWRGSKLDLENKGLSTCSPHWHVRLFAKFCQPAFDRLSAVLHAANQTKFFLALDECTTSGALLPDERGPSRSMSLIVIQRILKAAENMKKPVSFWFLTLDTSPSAGMQHSSISLAPSSRLTADLTPLPPFTYMDFNQLRHRLKKDTASASLSIENLKYLGRPVCPVFVPTV